MSIKKHGATAKPAALAAVWALCLLLCAALVSPVHTQDAIGPSGQIVIGLPDGIADDSLDILAAADGPDAIIVSSEIWQGLAELRSRRADTKFALHSDCIARAGSARGPPTPQA